MNLLNWMLEKKIPNHYNQGSGIPKRIVQVYPTKAGIPTVISENIERIKSNNPDWDYVFYDDNEMKNFIATEYPQLLSFYNRINDGYGAAKADFFRYLELYKNGGLYLDIKSGLTKPLNDSIKSGDEYILSDWHEWRDSNYRDFNGWGLHPDLSHIEGGEYQQWHIIAAPGHPFLRAVIISMLRNMLFYIPNRHGVGRMAVLRLTGPIVYTLAIENILKLHNHRRTNGRSDFGLEYRFLEELDHKQLYSKGHYSMATHPLLKLNKITALLNASYGFIKRSYYVVRKTLRA